MTGKPYTDADVELAARAEFDADQRRLVAATPDPAAFEPTPWSLPILSRIREVYRDRARAGLDALPAAGRLAALDDAASGRDDRTLGGVPVTADQRTARILRYEVPVDDQWHTLTLAGPIVHIATRDPQVVEVWATDDGFGSQELDLIVVGTGQPYPVGGDVCHRGTAIAPGGDLVWHLMQRGPGRLVPTKEQQ